MESIKFKPKRIMASRLGNIAQWGDKTPEERFWGHVSKKGNDDCWEWMAGKSKKGYGKTHLRGRSLLAHRVAWEFTHGRIPEGKFACHKCDNPPCCNPAHLFIGGYLENARDCVAKGRQRQLKGEACGRSKLSEAAVRRLIDLLRMRKDFTQLAVEFGVSKSCVQHIYHRRCWKHLQGV